MLGFGRVAESQNGGTSVHQSNEQDTSDDANVNITAVDKLFMSGKVLAHNVKFLDLDKIHIDIIRLEEGTNRSMRIVNRKVNNSIVSLKVLTEEVNVGFATVAKRVDQCAERLDQLVIPQNRFIDFQNDPPPSPVPNEEQVQNEFDGIFGDNADGNEDAEVKSAASAHDEFDDAHEDPFLSDNSINGLSHEGLPPLEIYSDDNIVTFDRWAQKFRERMEAFGTKLSEQEKLSRLALFLDDTPKQILDRLNSADKSTYKRAIESIRNELDSPQRRSLSEQALAMCRQREDESVKDFVSRLRPLALTTVADLPPAAKDQKERQLRHIFLERLRPNISLCMKMLNFQQQNRTFEQLCMDAREVEIMLSGNSGTTAASNIFHSVQTMQTPNNQPSPLMPAGNFQTLASTNPNRVQPQNGWRYGSQNNNQNRGNPRWQSSGFKYNQRINRWQQMPQNDRRWNNRPVCQYCNKVGHLANACRSRLADFQNKEPRTNYSQDQVQNNQGQVDRNLLIEIRDLLKISNPPRGASAQQNINAIEKGKSTQPNEPKESKSHPPQIVSWEGTNIGPKLMPIMTIMLICLALPTIGATSIPSPKWPMICQTEKQSMLWSFPQFSECPAMKTNLSHIPVRQLRGVFIQNDLEYSTEGWACRKTRKTARKFTTISNVPMVEPLESTPLDVTPDECAQMVHHQRCSLGSLQETKGLWETNNRIDVSPKMWFIGSFSWTTVQSENCYAFKTQIDSHFGDESIKTPLGETKQCKYSQGQCILDDKTVLTWKPVENANCRYRQIGQYWGRFVDNIWLSDDAQFALQFPKNVHNVTDCRSDLELSQQGFATQIQDPPKRNKRDENSLIEGLGLVTSPELAAKLTYLDHQTVEALNFAFAHSLKAMCEHLESIKNWATLAYFSDPTGLVRAIFKNDLLFAKREANSLLRIWLCVALEQGNFHFRGTNLDECFELLPIQFKTDGDDQLAFLEPRTMIVQPVSRKAPCSRYRKILVQLDGRVMEVDQITDQWKEAGDSLVKAAIGDYTNAWKWFITGAIILLGADLIIRWLLIAAERYLGDGKLGRMLIGNRSQQLARALQQSQVQHADPFGVIITGKPDHWPPHMGEIVGHGPSRQNLEMSTFHQRNNSQNIQINTISSLNPNTAMVRALINHKPVNCLIDTGASLSIMPTSLLTQVKTKLFPADAMATSASGHEIVIEGMAHVDLEIAGCALSAMVHVVDDSRLNKNREYQLIIGCDLLKKLPKMAIDFEKGKVYFGDNVACLGITNQNLAQNVKLYALNNTEIPSGAHKIVEAKLETACELGDVLIHKLDNRLIQEHIGLIPVVSTPKEGIVNLLMSNPTNAPKIIFAGMHIAMANELKNSQNGSFLEERSCDSIQVQKGIHIDPSFRIDFSKSSVAGEDLRKLKELCEEFSDVFSKSQYDLGSCLAGEHDIVTTTEQPVSSKPHRVPFKYREELQKHIDQLLKSGVMVKSDTPWVSNIVLVQKKDGGLRPCIDFRKLNEVTVPDHFPLPRLEMIMEKIGNCCFYSSLDLSSGYLQIRLTERASRKCGLITEDEIYQMTHMPFGLRNATSAFARVMAHVISGLEDHVLAYVDDFLIFTKSPNFDDHLSALKNVFERLRKYFLKVSPKKCVLASATMNFLGFVISAEGYTPSLSKVEIIKKFPAPTTVKEVKQIVGMASFFRKHVPNFSTIVEPLTRLTRKESAFVWDDEQQEALDSIKKILSEKPVLVFPDYSKPFHIFTDASAVGQGGALMQKDEVRNVYHSIAYCSRTLSASERKWPAVQTELGAIIYALREFRPFIYMATVELHTDHKPLAYLLEKAEAHPNLARWLIELQNFNIKIVHVAGKQNSLADALSRNPHEQCTKKETENLKELEDIAEFPVCLNIIPSSRLALNQCLMTITLRREDGQNYAVNIQEEQVRDVEASAYINFIEHGMFPDGISESEKESFAAMAVNLSLNGGILFHHPPNSYPRIFVPVSLRALIFDSFHSSPLGGGHMSLKKTLRKCRKYFWPRMHADIVFWIRKCITCQLRHSPNPAYRAEMQMVPVNTLFAKVGLDLAGPFPQSKSGNRHLMNIICWFTKYVISIPVPDAKAATLAKAFLNNCYLRFGGCTELVTDNATAFTSEFFRYFCSMLYINKRYATPHWSQGNAVTERSFRTFHNIVAKYITKEQPDFDEHICFASFCYNTSIHASTGETPFFLMFGRDPIFCVDQILDPRVREQQISADTTEFKQKLVSSLKNAWERASAANKEAQEKAKAQYDKLIRNPTISVGDRVLLRNYCGKVGTSKKFHMPWKGVFRIIEIKGVLATIISCNSPQSNPRTVHINQLKKCFDDVIEPACTFPELSAEEKQALDEANAEEVLEMPGYDHENSKKRSVPENIQVGVAHETDLPADQVETEDVPAEQGKKYNLRDRNTRRIRRLSLDLITIVGLLSFLPLSGALAHQTKNETSPLWLVLLVFITMGTVLTLNCLYQAVIMRYRKARQDSTTPSQ